MNAQQAATNQMTAYPDADVIHIGYPKTASTFVNRYLESHPEVTTDHNRILPLLWSYQPERASVLADKPSVNKVHFCRDELIALSITANESGWRRDLFVPGAWDKVKDDFVLDAAASATRLQKLQPRAKILLTIREQADWLHSAYKYSMSSLPAAQRRFADFCATPVGIVYLQAGHFDQTIQAYVDIFGSHRVRILRYEDLIAEPKRFTAELCAFIGISERPIPKMRQNETNAQVARFQRLFPIIDRLPRKMKVAMRPYATRLLPGGRGMILSSREVRILRSLYAASNQRTEKLLGQLSVMTR
jgi:hypothetical protein